MNVHTFRQKLFQYRGYTPIPFLIAMLFFARPVGWTMLAGGILAGCGEFLRFWGVAYAGSLTRVTGGVGAPEVIVAGPFAHVRNPLYLGNILLYTGVGVMSNALFPWLVLIALAYFVFQYSEIVALEEEFLLTTFGATYDKFRNEVPRFLPRLSSFRHEAQATQRPDWTGALRSEKRTLQAIVLVLAVLIAFWVRG
ncbi:MAG TPA: isoprenylcysteine carboxylmethyltransferase family protein [Bacteroidota bacterium]